MPEFNAPADIGNRALQRVGAQMMDPVLGFTDGSNNANQVSFCYGKLRRAELMRNIWTFATREATLRPVDTNTMLLNPTLWDQMVIYFVGSVVADESGTLWESIIRSNLGNDPQNTPFAWAPYYSTMTAEPFDSSKAYYVSELVYTFSGLGTYRVYRSLTNGNSVHPGLPNQWTANTIYNTNDVVQTWPAWSSGTTYSQGQTVQYTDGNIYSSLVNGNLNHIPPSSGSQWALMPVLILQSQLVPTNTFTAPSQLFTTPVDEWQIATAYSLGSFVVYFGALYVSIANSNTGNYPNAAASTFWKVCSGGTLYQSLVDLNQDNAPASSPSQWTTTFTLGGGNSLWILLGAPVDFPNGVGLTALRVIYPVGCGPLSQSWTKNVYRLPANYLRKAPQQPKAGVWSWLGAPGNLTSTDWTIEGDYMTTWNSSAIVYRFICDVEDVGKFPDMFCEALACRVALEVCEPITQSTAKLQIITQEYKKFVGDAIMQNAIEVGPVTPPLDDLIACRL